MKSIKYVFGRYKNEITGEWKDKTYLSCSAISLWQRDKNQYRFRYYMNGPSFENKETIFGKKMAQMLEDSTPHPVLDRVPRYKWVEHGIKVKVSGIPFLGVIDSFSKRRKRVIEYKSGKVAWDDVRVRNHDQLVIYSLLTKLKYGKVDPWLRLVWIETRYKPSTDLVGGEMMEGESNELEFTGKIQVFKRRVSQWERDRMTKKIKKIALEIHNDYTTWLSQNK